MLVQFYSVVELQDKLDVLHSFIKTHLQAKVIVFLSSCKQVSAEVCHDTVCETHGKHFYSRPTVCRFAMQVQFLHEAFCHLRPGIPVTCLHGKMKQMKRLAAFYEFCEAKYVCDHVALTPRCIYLRLKPRHTSHFPNKRGS